MAAVSLKDKKGSRRTRYDPEEEDLERGRAAMAAFPTQESESYKRMQK